MVAGMASTLRLAEPLKLRAEAYARKTGVSVASLVAIALADYLDGRERGAEPVGGPPVAPPAAEVPQGSTERARRVEAVFQALRAGHAAELDRMTPAKRAQEEQRLRRIATKRVADGSGA